MTKSFALLSRHEESPHRYKFRSYRIGVCGHLMTAVKGCFSQMWLRVDISDLGYVCGGGGGAGLRAGVAELERGGRFR